MEMVKVKQKVGLDHPVLELFGEEWEVAEPLEDVQDLAEIIGKVIRERDELKQQLASKGAKRG